MRRMPALYLCKVCGLQLRPADATSVRLAKVWLKSKGTSISRVVEELHEYRHEFCDDRNLGSDIQDPLF